MWNPAWSGDRIRPVVILVFLPWVACLYALIGAVPLLLLVWPALLRLGGSVQTFGLAGFGIALPVLLLVVALVRTARLWRIRRAFLHLEGIPVFLGQELRGEFVPLPESAIESPVHLRLEFVNTSSKGKSSATLRIPMAESDASRVEAGAFDPAAFAIRIATNDAWPGTDERDMQDRSFWQLTVTVGTGWRRGRLRFPIPLYRRRGRSGPPASPA